MQWWIWVVIGLFLSIAEIFVLGFFVIWLGISAIFIGILSFFISFSLSNQIIFWAIGSILLLWIWFKYLKGNSQDNYSKIGQSDNYKDVKGEIIQKIEKNRYKAKFEIPILGDRNWIVESEEELKVGDKIVSNEVYGQLLKVKKVK
jgi:membrane protein implicated in regulation of membrane protease activity